MKPSDLPERFAAKIEIAPSGCWLWTAGRQGEGYGALWFEGRSVLAHRFVYQRLIGEIPEGMQIDHVRARGCRSKLCVNPAHLEIVTNRENTLRGDHPNVLAFRAGGCRRGHDASEFYRRKRGPRKGDAAYCLACKREERAAA